MLPFIFIATLSLVACQSPFGERYPGGMGGMGSESNMGSSPYHRGSPGPFITTTTVTTVTDLGTGMIRSYHSSSPYGGDRTSWGGVGDKKLLVEGVGLYNVLNENDIEVIKSSWSTLKKRGDFAPKVFIRYFKAKPESQKLFPTFANVPITELPTNHDFLNQAYTCVTSLNYILPHLQSLHPEKCPAFTNLKSKYNEVDLKRFGSIWMTAMQEEMGNNFTNEVRDIWKKAFMALSNYASQ